MPKTIGQAAYEKWRLRQWEKMTSPWDDLHLTEKGRWEEIATAAVEQYGLNQRTGTDG